MREETESNLPAKAMSVTPSVLDAFDLLKDNKDDVRLVGGTKILTLLQHNENEKDIHYAVKRLVRSLGANEPAFRTGYFATLVALLKRYKQIDVAHLINLVKKELHAKSSSKSEVGDISLGQILVCSAVFRSGLMLTCSEDEQKEVLQLLLNAGQKKSYLGTVAYMVLLDFVNQLEEQQFASIVWNHLKADIKKDVKDHSLDSLYFLIIVSKKFPKKVKLRKLIGADDILCEDNIHFICEKIMGGIDFNSLSHPIYQEVGKEMANSPHLLMFWTSGVDNQLVKHNRNRELVSINMLTTILNNMQLNFEIIPDLLSTNFFKLFMDWFKGLQTASKIRNKRDNEDDQKLMITQLKELLNTLAKTLKNEKVDNKVRVEVLKKLLINPGEVNFNEITGTSIIKSIVADLDKAGVLKMAKLFKGILLNTSKKVIKEGTERVWYNNERVKAAELISYLVTHESVKDDIEFKLMYMKILMCFGFFKIGGDDNVTVSSELSATIKSCFYRCFTSRFTNVDTLVSVLSSLCAFVCGLLQKEQVRSKIEKQFSQSNMECWEVVTTICQNIEANKSKSKVDNVFLILFYQLGLFLFSDPAHIKMATSSIKELKSCYEHYKKGKKKKTKNLLNGDLDDNEPEWIEVLVEVLLSILSVESSVLRSVVQCVFRLLWEYLTPSCMGQIVSVLDPDSETNPLTQDDDNSESEKEDESDDEISEEADEEKNGDDEEGSDDSDDEADDEEMKTPEQLRLAVQKALGVDAESDNESLDADMIDEDQGKKLDEALAEAFRQFHKGKTTKKDRKSKKILSDFRIRVVDLIDIYLEKDPSIDICLAMIAPLTRCLEFCLQDNQFKELENRVRKTIKKLSKIRKFSSTGDVTSDILGDYLKANIDKGARSQFLFQALGDVITYFATFIIHCSQKVDVKSTKSPKKKAKSPLVQILKDALENYFQSRSCLLPIIFFHNLLQADWDGIYELVPVVVENIFNKDVRQFRRHEGVELVSGFYRALKRTKPTADNQLIKLSQLEANFEESLNNFFKSNTQGQLKKNFLVSLRKLLNTIKQFHECCHIESSLDFKLLLDQLSNIKGTVTQNNNLGPHQQQKQNDQNSKKKKKSKKRKLQSLPANGHAEPNGKKVKTASGNE